jgi:hypothetical protein
VILIPFNGLAAFATGAVKLDILLFDIVESVPAETSIPFTVVEALEPDKPQILFLNTFVDVNIYGSTTYSTTKLLVLNKYYDYNNSAYAIEFHKRLNFTLGDANILSGGSLDIISRRHLYQISDDLQYLNNIQRSEGKITEVYQGLTYSNYENELNFKIPTDSYTKILLSDAETIQSLSSIIYVDDKNELALNITKLSKEYVVPISNTSNFGGKLYISCSEKHDLFTGDSAVLEFNGGSQSSQTLNQQYFGYHVITKITDYKSSS